MNHFIVAVVLCFTTFGSTFATDQHLICKSVDDVFSSDEQVHSTRRLRGSVQGPPGKLGPKGVKGDTGQKGERGSEGIVDYSTINDTLEEMVTSATAALQAKVEKLENENLNITKQLNRLAVCPEGFIYLGKCYFMKLFQSSSPRSHGEQTCSKNFGTMADIISLGQQTLVMEYMRGKISDTRSALFNCPMEDLYLLLLCVGVLATHLHSEVIQELCCMSDLMHLTPTKVFSTILRRGTSMEFYAKNESTSTHR